MTLLAEAPLSTRTTDRNADVVQAVRRYHRLGTLLPRAAVRYAVRTDARPDLLEALAAAGCSFEVAGADEARACLAVGATPEHLVTSAVRRGRHDIGAAADLGVRLFVVACPEDVCNVALAAPGAAVLHRLMTTAPGPDCVTRQAVVVLRQAAASGLEAAGISCHAGTPRDPRAWRAPIAAAGRIFSALKVEGLRPWVLDLGGGLPAPRQPGTPPLSLYGAAIDLALAQTFGGARPRTLVAVGRTLVG